MPPALQVALNAPVHLLGFESGTTIRQICQQARSSCIGSTCSLNVRAPPSTEKTSIIEQHLLDIHFQPAGMKSEVCMEHLCIVQDRMCVMGCKARLCSGYVDNVFPNFVPEGRDLGEANVHSAIHLHRYIRSLSSVRLN
jgi:hypothetical protein